MLVLQIYHNWQSIVLLLIETYPKAILIRIKRGTALTAIFLHELHNRHAEHQLRFNRKSAKIYIKIVANVKQNADA